MATGFAALDPSDDPLDYSTQGNGKRQAGTSGVIGGRDRRTSRIAKSHRRGTACFRCR